MWQAAILMLLWRVQVWAVTLKSCVYTAHLAGQHADACCALSFPQGLSKITGMPAPAPYQPDYTLCADHFLLHAGV
jgi:hypothetical protein